MIPWLECLLVSPDTCSFSFVRLTKCAGTLVERIAWAWAQTSPTKTEVRWLGWDTQSVVYLVCEDAYCSR